MTLKRRYALGVAVLALIVIATAAITDSIQSPPATKQELISARNHSNNAATHG